MPTVVVLPGDGIGPEVVRQARTVLTVLEQRWGPLARLEELPLGGHALELTGECLPVATLEAASSAAAVLVGAVGDPAWDDVGPASERPTAALLRLRQELGCHTGLRQVRLPPVLSDLSPLRSADVGRPVDLVIVRELSRGLFGGRPRGRRVLGDGGEEEGFDTMTCRPSDVARVSRVARELAVRRRRLVTSVDQANVLESSAVWRETITRLAEDYGEVRLEHMLIDNCANELVRNPGHFDVIVTDGAFGGIISDEAGAITGSIGMLASASVGEGPPGIFEPVHGSAPRHAGKDRVNPIGAIRALAQLLEFGLGLTGPAREIEDAIVATVAAGFRTYDIASRGCTVVGTSEMGSRVAEALARLPDPSKTAQRHRGDPR